MPPKAKISKEMIVAAGLELVRSEGADALSVRAVAARLGCSTQPVMYHYDTVSSLRADIYAAADELHTHYITQPGENGKYPMHSIGLRYIRFADEEKNLFRFLFQSGYFNSKSIRELLEADELEPVIRALCAQTGLAADQAREVFGTLFICVHGAASLLANNSMEFDEAYFSRLLENTLTGAVGALKREEMK
ncbi:MAG: TetR/AcrR family transcriptional regulator [Oscillospiraceae bacterium]|nr:TetR/AcrR family transcriptional regulator [Oscillospiraceae bacterium]